MLVRGVVVAEAGRLGTPPVLVIADATGGLPVRLGNGQAAPPRGTLVEVHGTIADPYGQTELRVDGKGPVTLGSGSLPSPRAVVPGAIGEGVEGRLVVVHGTVTVGATRATSGDIALTIRGDDGTTIRVLADGSAGIATSALRKGVVAKFTGIVGQRASRKGALDGYRIWLRDAADVIATPTPSPSPSATPSPSPTASPKPTSSPAPAVEPIATAVVRDGATVTVEGTVTADRTLLDASGRRTVLEDATGAVELYLAAPDPTVRLGARLRVTGTMGRAWGAPRLHATTLRLLGSASPVVHDLRVAPGAASEWRLVRVTGTITSLHRAGDRWVAELATPGGTIPVTGLAGAGIPAAMLGEGRRATVIGIVKRPYPSASDRRFAIVPRRPADLDVGPAPAPASSPAATDGSGAGGTGTAVATSASGDPGPGASGATIPQVDLRDLGAKTGNRVRAGGLITAVDADGFRLDDGTAVAGVVLAGDAADLAAILGPGDAVDVTGDVELRGQAVIVVRDPAGLLLLGGTGVAAAATAPVVDTSPGAATRLPADLTHLAPLAKTDNARVDPIVPGLASLLLVILAGLVAAIAHRRRDQRRLGDRIRARLDAIGGALPAPVRAPELVAERVPVAAGGAADA